MSDGSLHPAENRGYRELYAAARQIERHWSGLAERLSGSDAAKPLESGAEAARTLLDELRQTTARYDLHGFPAARNAGAALAGARRVREPFLERNQALRLAVLDGQHAATLTAYLASLAAVREDEELAEFCRRWERRLSRAAGALRRAAVDLGTSADEAIEPLERGPVGKAAHRAAYAVGSFGEWLDRRTARKQSGG